MSGNHNRGFEYYRDSFFVNPKNPDVELLTGAASAVIEGIVTGASPTEPEATDHPLATVTHELVDEYNGQGNLKNGARRFDNLSVAQLHPSDNMIGLLAHVASTLVNNNTIIGEVSPVETAYEGFSMDWMLENVAGYDPDKGSGSLVSGGTSANNTALAIAREALQEQGWDGITPATIFASEMTHYSISKAARLLAPRGIIQVERVPLTPDDYTMDVDALNWMVREARGARMHIMGIVAVAGETETGLVDDIETIAQISEENGIYLHVDGAYGAPFVMSRAGALLKGVEGSTSLTCDPHKYMFVPYASGSIMFADRQTHALLEELNSDGGDYMFKDDEAKHRAREEFIHSSTYLGRKRLEGSMGGQSAAALMHVIRQLGRDGLGKLLDHTIDMAELFTHEMIEGDGATSLKLSFDPHLNTVCLEPTESYAGNDMRVEQVSATLESEKGIYLSTTSLPNRDGTKGKRKVFRFVATHPHTGADDIRYITTSLKETWEDSL